MARSGVWDLQQVRDKYLKGAWNNPIRGFTWGSNTYGQLGQNVGGNPGARSSPTQVGADDAGWKTSGIDQSTTYLTSADAAHFAIKTDGTLWGWGNNQYGSVLGINISNGNFSSPCQIGTDTNWKTFDAGDRFMLAVKTDGTAWGWGNNAEGRLGLNDKNSRSSPTQIGTNTNWSSFSGGSQHSVGRKTDGTLWVFGNNQSVGSLGLNSNQTSASRSSPTQLPGTNWTDKYTAGYGFTAAIKTDGTLWTWGSNSPGVLGNNVPHSDGNRSSPIQVGTDTNWLWIGYAGKTAQTVSAMKTDGTLWSWGRNANGQCGLNFSNSTNPGNPALGVSSPKQVAGTWDTTKRVCNSDELGIGLKSDKTLWVWGRGFEGALGLNQGSTTSFSSPVQLPGGSWMGMSPGGKSVLAIGKPLAE